MDAIHPCLPSHGNAGRKCQTDASKFITADHYVTGGRHLYVHVRTHCPVCIKLLKASCTTFYGRRKDALARFPLLAALCKLALCQLKPEVHQQVTFSNIRALSKWKYAAA